MLFDTTASNTGHLTGACICLQSEFGRALLWCACRHHIGELILSHVFEDLQIEVSKSPDVSLFARFQKHFDQIIGKNYDFNYGDFEDYNPDAQEVLMESRDTVINSLKNKPIFARNDYKIFYVLCEILLKQKSDNIHLNQPGALHKARWMAKLLYSIKIILLKNHVFAQPRGSVFNSEEHYLK